MASSSQPVESWSIRPEQFGKWVRNNVLPGNRKRVPGAFQLLITISAGIQTLKFIITLLIFLFTCMAPVRFFLGVAGASGIDFIERSETGESLTADAGLFWHCLPYLILWWFLLQGVVISQNAEVTRNVVRTGVILLPLHLIALHLAGVNHFVWTGVILVLAVSIPYGSCQVTASNS